MKWDVWKIIILVFSITVCCVVMTTFLGIVIFKIPSTEANSQIRMFILQLVNSISTAIFTIITMQYRKNEKDHNDNS